MRVVGDELRVTRATPAAGEEASFRVVAKDAHNNTNDRTTEVGGDSFFYSVIGEGGYVKWAVASAASDGAPGAYDGSFLANVSGAATVRVTLGAALVRETTIVVRPGVFSPEESTVESDGVPNAVAGETYAVTYVARDAHANRLVEGGVPLEMVLERVGVEGTDATLDVTDRGDGTYASRFGVNETGGWSLTPRAGQIVGFTASSVVVVAGARDLEATRAGGASTYRPGPYVAGVSGEFKVTFMDARGNNRYASGDMDEGTLTLIVTDEDGAETTVAPSAVTYHPRTDPDAALRGAFVVAFTSSAAGTLSIAFVDTSGESMVNPATNAPWTAVVRPGALDPDATVAYGAGAEVSAMGLSNAIHLRASDTLGNVILEQPRDANGVAHAFALAFEALEIGSHPSDADVSAMGLANATYVTRGAHSVYFVPPTHASPYYLRATVVVDGEATRATHDFLVTAAGNANAYASAVLDARMRDVDVSRPLVGFFAGVVGRLTLEIRDDFGAAVGAPSASFARVSMIPDGANPSLELTSHGRIALTFNATVAGEYAIFIEAGGAGAF